MICEECGVREAKFHLVTVVNGVRKVQDLCPVCMAKHRQNVTGIDISNLAGILNGILKTKNNDGEEVVDEATASLVCEQCGMTYGEFNKCGMLGCSGCYKAFKEPLTALLQRVHGNTQHAGRIPGRIRSGVSIRMNIDRMRQQLKRAIADENYEEAAKLRDAIRSLTAQLNEVEQGDIQVPPSERLEEGGAQDE
ncbi:MAG: UvrB/UvrC motif-containing protein [Clostridia bacterium]|nr:UvrB/UvrC motif-containing protein [Clostridia bacterium]